MTAEKGAGPEVGSDPEGKSVGGQDEDEGDNACPGDYAKSRISAGFEWV
jgi:hypothetical protein